MANGSITYTTAHEVDDHTIVATWSVPYHAAIRGNTLEDIEADGLPTLLSLEQVAIPNNLALPLPPLDSIEMRAWKNRWCQATNYTESELLDLFSADAIEKHWSKVQGDAA